MATPRAANHRDLEQILRDLDRKQRASFSIIYRGGGGSIPWDNRGTASGGLTETVRLDFHPVAHSVHVYWHGVYQDDVEWTMGGDGFDLVLDNSAGWYRPGDPLVVKYEFTDPTPAPPPVLPVYSAPISHYVVSEFGSHSSTPITSRALPPETELGALLVVSAIGAGGVTISDPRVSVVTASPNRAIAVGYADDLSDLDCSVVGTGFPLDQFAGISVLAVHGSDDGVAFDPDRIAIHTPTTGGPIGSVAAGAGHGSIVALCSGWAGPITLDMATDMPAYTDYGGAAGTAVLAEFGYCATEPPPAQTNPANADTLAVVIGLK